MNLKETATRAPGHFRKEVIKTELPEIYKELAELQDALYAEHRRSVLVIVQGMDASGKDGLIRDVFGGLNPQGLAVKSFKIPTEEENDHDFLWRVHQHTPAKGMIHVFNRSQYEAVLVTRVHKLISDKKAQKLFRMLNDFEYLLTEDGHTHVLKFFLHVSPERQTERMEARLTDPKKMWKYDANDWKESRQYESYIQFYEEMMEHCNTIPWHIVPSDQNWYKDYFVAVALRDLLRSLKLKYPEVKE